MKRIFTYLAAVSLLAACSEDDGIAEAIDNGPETGGGNGTTENPVTGYKAYVEVATDCGDTRATYDSALKPLWEENDVIALHQMAAAGGSTSADKAELAIKEGWGTQNARFGAEVELTTADNRYFCFAYPSTAAAFSTSDEIEAVGDINYQKHTLNISSRGYYTASGTYKHVYTTSCGITIPTVQHGKWEPYMYAFTGESKPAEQLGSFRFTTLNGAICLRVSAKDADGNTKSKQLKEIIITSDKPIAGTFTCKSTSEGMLETLTGDKSREGSFVLIEQEMREEALANLANKARAASPAATTATTDNSNPSWSFSEGHNAITVTGLENIKPENGEYLYYINIAPVTGAKLEITLKDKEDFECMRTVEALTLAANHRKGYNITWDEDSIAVEFDDQSTGELTTTYSSYLDGDIAAANNFDNTHTISGATIKGIAKLKGRYTQDQIEEYGCRLLHGSNIEEGTLVKEIKSNTAFELAFGDITGQPLGEYIYYLYVKAKDGKEFTSDPKHIYITGLPYECTVWDATTVGDNKEWQAGGSIETHSSYIDLKENASGSWMEQKFNHIPADINVKINSKFGCRRGSDTWAIHNSNIFHLYVSGEEIATKEGEYTTSDYSNTMHNFTDVTGTLKVSNPTIRMFNTHPQDHNSFCHTQVSSFKLEYR